MEEEKNTNDLDRDKKNQTKDQTGDISESPPVPGRAMDGGKEKCIREHLSIIQSHILSIQHILQGTDDGDEHMSKAVEEGQQRIGKSNSEESTYKNSTRIIEGVFDGQAMMSAEGKKYQVPPNYASKSKLVEGDILKLTIGSEGNFVFKQIGPIERDRIVGKLVRDSATDEFKVITDEKSYKVLTASITYFKGEEGDEVIILVPKNAESKWAAVENIIKKDV